MVAREFLQAAGRIKCEVNVGQQRKSDTVGQNREDFGKTEETTDEHR
jgi:hypothetical protein